MKHVRNYLSLIKFSHTVFALPFAMIGFFLASVREGYGFDLKKLLLVTGCMVFGRSAAMAFNRWLDKHFDALNPRTAIREIPAGVVSANSALLFVIANSIAFLACTWFINRLCFVLAPVALFVILFYSYTKRFTALCHLILGLGLSLAPTGAYIAVTGAFAWLPVVLSLAVLCWVSGFDIIYALQDEDFDRENRLHSIPASIGKPGALRVSALLHLVCAAAVIFIGVYGRFGWEYWSGVALFTGLLVYQHSIVSPYDLSRVNLDFMKVNGFASILFSCFVLSDFFFNRLP